MSANQFYIVGLTIVAIGYFTVGYLIGVVRGKQLNAAIRVQDNRPMEQNSKTAQQDSANEGEDK